MTRKKAQLYIALAPLLITGVGGASWALSALEENRPEGVKPPADSTDLAIPKLHRLELPSITTPTDGSDISYAQEESPVVTEEPAVTPPPPNTVQSANSKPVKPTKPSLLSVRVGQLLQINIP